MPRALNSNLVGRKVKMDFHTWNPSTIYTNPAERARVKESLLPAQFKPVYAKFGESSVAEVVTGFTDSDGAPKFQVLMPNGSILECYANAFTVVMPENIAR